MRQILFSLLIGALGLGTLISLGNWQVRRLAEKEAYLAQIEASITAPAQPLPEQPDADAHRFLPVEVSGEMFEDEIHVLVSVKQVGAGYRIISSFETAEGRFILIDRGFVPTTAKDTPRETGEMTVTGNLHWPDEIDGFTPEPDIDAHIWFARHVDELAALLGTEPVLVIARSQTDPNVAPLPVDTAGIPNDHLQYAVTWYGLALVWLVMTLYFLWRTRARSKGEDA
jgi:surfeit locus 1 family protein